MLWFKAVALRFISIIIVGSLLSMPHSSDNIFRFDNLKTENQEFIKSTTWSVAEKTVDLYLRPFCEMFEKHPHSERPLILKNSLNTFIKNITKFDLELPDSRENYIAYSKFTVQTLNKSYIFFPFHYFW